MMISKQAKFLPHIGRLGMLAGRWTPGQYADCWWPICRSAASVTSTAGWCWKREHTTFVFHDRFIPLVHGSCPALVLNHWWIKSGAHCSANKGLLRYSSHNIILGIFPPQSWTNFLASRCTFMSDTIHEMYHLSPVMAWEKHSLHLHPPYLCVWITPVRFPWESFPLLVISPFLALL